MSAGVDMLKALAESSRVRMIRLILNSSVELCACELADCLVQPPADISRHIKVLKHAGLVSEHKEGKWVYYRPAAVAIRKKRALLSLIGEAVSQSDAQADSRRLKGRMRLREQGKCLIGVKNSVLLKRLGRI